MKQTRPLLPGGQRRLAAGRIRGANSRGDREAVASRIDQSRPLASLPFVLVPSEGTPLWRPAVTNQAWTQATARRDVRVRVATDALWRLAAHKVCAFVRQQDHVDGFPILYVPLVFVHDHQAVRPGEGR